MRKAFEYIQKNGITTEGDYPYNAVQGTCKKEGGAYKDTGYNAVPSPGLF